MGITNMAATIPGFLVPMVVGSLTRGKVKNTCIELFQLYKLIDWLTNYLFFSSMVVQYWINDYSLEYNLGIQLFILLLVYLFWNLWYSAFLDLEKNSHGIVILWRRTKLLNLKIINAIKTVTATSGMPDMIVIVGNYFNLIHKSFDRSFDMIFMQVHHWRRRRYCNFIHCLLCWGADSWKTCRNLKLAGQCLLMCDYIIKQYKDAL